MITIVPQYYPHFKCIANKCKHNCCIGWEIDIDPHTYDLYCHIDGELGTLLKQNIEKSGSTIHFRLDQDERCPFLCDDGLCHIIKERGEAALCDICTDHPRFRNYYSSFVEMGLGMCCEEASRLILQWDKPFRLICVDSQDCETECTSEELEFLNMRSRIFDIIMQPDKDFDAKETELLKSFAPQMPEYGFLHMCDLYQNLEYMDSELIDMINRAYSSYSSDLVLEDKKHFREKILLYYIYRHTQGTVYDGRLAERVAFSVLSCRMIWTLYSLSDDKNYETLADICRLYSSEIEYSDENIEELIFGMY